MKACIFQINGINEPHGKTENHLSLLMKSYQFLKLFKSDTMLLSSTEALVFLVASFTKYMIWNVLKMRKCQLLFLILAEY